jgi:hypothetical protein
VARESDSNQMALVPCVPPPAAPVLSSGTAEREAGGGQGSLASDACPLATDAVAPVNTTSVT